MKATILSLITLLGASSTAHAMMLMRIKPKVHQCMSLLQQVRYFPGDRSNYPGNEDGPVGDRSNYTSQSQYAAWEEQELVNFERKREEAIKAIAARKPCDTPVRTMINEEIKQSHKAFSDRLDKEAELFRARAEQIRREEHNKLAHRLATIIIKDVDSKK